MKLKNYAGLGLIVAVPVGLIASEMTYQFLEPLKQGLTGFHYYFQQQFQEIVSVSVGGLTSIIPTIPYINKKMDEERELCELTG